MEISYFIEESKDLGMARGCYTQCYINSDMGSDYRCK